MKTPLLEPEVWAIREDALPKILARRGGEPLRPEAAAPGQKPAIVPSGIALIPVQGDIQPKSDLWSQLGLATALDAFRAELAAAVADPAVRSVVLEFDSPGGEVPGLMETAALMRSLRDQGKPIVAVVNPLAASAAYYLAAQASEIVMTPDAVAGWIGTVLVHREGAAMFEQMGITTTIVRSPARKYEANIFEPLTAAALQRFQDLVDASAAQFVADVAKGRGVSPATVRSDFGQGSFLMPKEAVAAGLADRIDTLDATIQRLLNTRGPRGGARQEAPQLAGPSPDDERERLALLGPL